MSSDNSPSFPSLHLHHSSFSNYSVALPTWQLIPHPLPLLDLRHSSFTNPSIVSPTSQALHLRHAAYIIHYFFFGTPCLHIGSQVLVSLIQDAPERTDGFHRQKYVLKLLQIKLLLVPSNSQVNAVYLWNTTSSIWCPWVLAQELRRLLKFLITLTVIAGVICWISSRITVFSWTRLHGRCLYTSPFK